LIPYTVEKEDEEMAIDENFLNEDEEMKSPTPIKQENEHQ